MARTAASKNEGEQLPEQPVQIDPNTGKPYEEASGGHPTVYEPKKSDPSPFVDVANDNFGLHVTERDIVQVTPKGWVGPPALEIHASKVDDLIDVLAKAKSAKAPNDTEEFELKRNPAGLVVAQEKTPHES